MTRVMWRRRQLSSCALALVCLFGLVSTRAAGAFAPTCTRCPVSCPMHAKKLGCHRGAGAARATVDDYGGKHLRPEPGLHCAGCMHHSDGPGLSDQPVVLSALASVVPAPPGPRGAPATFRRPAAVALDPPFHPPRIADPKI